VASCGAYFAGERCRGGQWRCHRELLDAMFWKLNTGAGWRDLPERYGPWQSVYDRFRRWEHDGTFAASSPYCVCNSTNWAGSTGTPGASMAPTSAPDAPLRALKKGSEVALGRSHGGWGSKSIS